MMRRFVAVFALLGLLAGLPAAGQSPEWPAPFGRADSPERSGIFPGSFGPRPYYPSWRSVWPVNICPLRTSKIRSTLNAVGSIYGDREDPFSFDEDASFEFPTGTGNQYLRVVYPLVGGILHGDTLVSRGSMFAFWQGGEIIPDNDPYQSNLILPIDAGAGGGLRTVLTDTTSLWMYDLIRPGGHKPLRIRLTEKLLVSDLGEFQNTLLFDFTITNFGSDSISEGYMALQFEPWVGRWLFDQYTPTWDDDLIGSFRDLASAYIIDNDGDPIDGHFRQGTSVIDGVGIRMTKAFPPLTDTNFNWWFNYANQTGDEYDFAPRHRDLPGDPFRDYGTGFFGFPDADVNLYYTMRHHEWDYDQIRTAQITPDDSLWMHPPNRSLAVDIANGFEELYGFLSTGPFDLAPGKSARVVFALFGADFIHTDPDNGQRLVSGEYDRYFNHLNFSIFRQRAQQAKDATEFLLSPQNPPTGLHPTYLSGDTVRLAWDPRVFDDIHGYNIYLTPVEDSFYITRRVVRPGVEPSQVRLATTAEPDQTEIELTGLDPSRFYFASIAHRTSEGVGRRSPSVVIGYGNRSLIPDTVQMKRHRTFYERDSDSIMLSWYPSKHPDVTWYRIYKVSDSGQAAGRYDWFFSIDSALSPVPPRRMGYTDGRPWCYYHMQPYDSVPAPQTGYVDRKISAEGWYWVTAVNKYGDESPFSRPVAASVTAPATKDILVILSSTTSLHDWVREDSLFAFYDRLLDGYDYDLYSWADTNRNFRSDDIDYNVDWLDIARYRMILVEEMTSPGVLTHWNEDAYHTLERIIASGRDLVYFGSPPGNIDLNINTDKTMIRYGPESFEARYFHLDSLRLCTWKGAYQTYGVVDTLGGFVSAQPEIPELTSITVDTSADRMTAFIHTLFSIDHYLPLTPGFFPDSTTELLYRFGSRFPQSSTLEGMPCGILSRHPGSNVYVFGFHLWAIDSTEARDLVDYVMDRQAPDSDLNPYFLPTTMHLEQNYPNPFNPTTTIAFELERRERVTLEIFDLLGRTTTTLVDRELAPGPHRIEWNGTDKYGHRVASGIYFYRLRSEGESLVRKMVLVK